MLCKKNLDFFDPTHHTPGAGREITEVKFRRSQADRAAPARVRIHSTLGLTIIAHDQPLRFSLSCRAPHAVPTTHESRGTLSVFLFFFGVPTPFLAGRSFFLFASRCAGRSFFLLASRCAARHARPPAKTRSLARIPTTDGRTTRRAVRRHG